MDNTNNGAQSFASTFKTIIGKIEINSSELVYLSDDNSFPDFLLNFVQGLGKDIECGILEQDFQQKRPGETAGAFSRYLLTIINNVSIKAIGDKLVDTIKDVNILFTNWIRMVEENNLYEIFSFEKSIAFNVADQINDTDSILSGTLNLERLIWISGNLIDKAKEIIAAVPPSFNISEHYSNAVAKALED